MFLQKVRVQNFRNLKDLEVDFTAGLNVIVGENNIGKTNLLDAIRAALGPASFVGDALRLNKTDRHRDAQGTYASEPIRIDLWFANLGPEEQAECLEILDFDPLKPEESKASIHFEWNWNEASTRWRARRWGGDRPAGEGGLPDELMQALPLTLLGALRDALVALSPGRQNRLAQLLQTLATTAQQEAIEAILTEANAKLQKEELVVGVERRIGQALIDASGPRLSQQPIVRATEPSFDRIVSNLRLILQERDNRAGTITELRNNGLGFNNLLYIATVLAELDASRDATLPLLLVEEPEAHLHPQLQTLLTEHLAPAVGPGIQPGRVQTIVTTHSPTIASHVPPEMIRVLHKGTGSTPRCVSIGACGLTQSESLKLRRMLDVTRATMLFARGVVLVEGLSESLLLPVLAKTLGPKFDLGHHSIAVVAMGGVAFETFGKLFGDHGLQIPVAIVTDGDPPILCPDDTNESAVPQQTDDFTPPCARVEKLTQTFEQNPFVKVFHSSVTFEYDLAEASVSNGLVLYEAWRSCYDHSPRSLSREQVVSAASARELWRAICLGAPVHGKAELAQALATHLESRNDDSALAYPEFEVPRYLREAFSHVLGFGA